LGGSPFCFGSLNLHCITMRANTSYFRLGVLTLALAGAAIPLRAALESKRPAHTPFVAVLLRDFDSWDANHDGVLSADEIEHVVMDPAVKGDDAAAAAAIKLLSRSKKNTLPPLTKSFFEQYDKLALELSSHRAAGTTQPSDAMSATVDTVASASTTRPAARSSRLPADFDLYFNAGKQRIARGGPVPFTGRFALEDTRQGPLGDCFFVSSISSLAYHDPARFAQMISPKPDGSYVVKLPATQPIDVPAPTDAELAISSTTAGDGVWLAVMEQAFGKYRARLHGGSEEIDGTELIRTGGDSMPTIRALTGRKAIRFSFGKTVEDRAANADTVLPKLRRELVSALAEHRVITAGIAGRTATTQASGTIPPLPPDISSNHVYAVLDYDPKTDIVEIWNPHGQQFKPKGPAGLKFGYPTDHGRFKLPLTEAFAFYSSFTFEAGAE
jgi:hypothetical protein